MNYKNYYCVPRFSETENLYYGKISGDEPLGMVEAETVDELEAVFHQKVDQHLERKKEKSAKRRTGWTIGVVIAVALVAVLAITCPDKQKHKAVLADRLTVALSDAEGYDGLDAIISLAGYKMLDMMLDSYLVTDNYFFFSVGSITVGGEKKVLSVGLLGHVFAPSSDKIREEFSNEVDLMDFVEAFF